MPGLDTKRIDEDHFNLLAEHGEQIALITARNLDEGLIGGLYSIHEYEESYVIESAHQVWGRPGELDARYELLGHGQSPSRIVSDWLDEFITSQRQSDDDTRFTWELETGIDSVVSDDRIQDLCDDVVDPARLEPKFDIPNEDAHAVLELSSEGHTILEQANDRKGWAAVDLFHHRGETHVVGLTTKRARALSEAVNELKQGFSDRGIYESAEVADEVESKIFAAAAEVAGEA